MLGAAKDLEELTLGFCEGGRNGRGLPLKENYLWILVLGRVCGLYLLLKDYKWQRAYRSGWLSLPITRVSAS
jgi:hypothetical protein